jgi:DNA-binding response OmpR family regulator
LLLPRVRLCDCKNADLPAALALRRPLYFLTMSLIFVTQVLGLRSALIAAVRLDGAEMLYFFENFVLDPDRRELRRGNTVVALQPQVFDLLEYLIANRDRVVSKDDILGAIWGGRIVSESALTTRVNAARTAVGDNGDEQRLIRTFPRKGIRFVGLGKARK